MYPWRLHRPQEPRPPGRLIRPSDTVGSAQVPSRRNAGLVARRQRDMPRQPPLEHVDDDESDVVLLRDGGRQPGGDGGEQWRASSSAGLDRQSLRTCSSLYVPEGLSEPRSPAPSGHRCRGGTGRPASNAISRAGYSESGATPNSKPLLSTRVRVPVAARQRKKWWMSGRRIACRAGLGVEPQVGRRHVLAARVVKGASQSAQKLRRIAGPGGGRRTATLIIEAMSAAGTPCPADVRHQEAGAVRGRRE